MIFDVLFSVGGDSLVRFADAILGPLFGMICDKASHFGGMWNTLATIFEMLMS